MQINYFKEITAVKELAYKNEKFPSDYEYIPVQYFSGLQIDSFISEMLNSRIEEVTKLYNDKLGVLHKKNMILSKQIELFTMTGPQSGLKINEMNCKSITHYLYTIEKDPFIVWKCLTEKYGNDFFITEIQK